MQSVDRNFIRAFTLRACIYAKHQTVVDLDAELKRQKIKKLQQHNDWYTFSSFLNNVERTIRLFQKFIDNVINAVVVIAIGPVLISLAIYFTCWMFAITLSPTGIERFLNDTTAMHYLNQRFVKIGCHFNNTQSVYMLSVIEDSTTWWPWFFAYFVHFWKYCVYILIDAC